MVSCTKIAKVVSVVFVASAVVFVYHNWVDDIFGEGTTTRLGDASKKVLTFLVRAIEPKVNKLDVPRHNHNVTEPQVKGYLSRSLIGTCGWQRIMNRDCFCAKYKPIKHISNKSKGSAVVIASIDDMLVVSFRPTNSRSNWRTDMDALLAPLPGAGEDIKVHKGFLEYYQSIQKELEDKIAQLLSNSSNTLHLTGYSLGGSVAIVSLDSVVKRLRRDGIKNKVQVYAYASPRVGNRKFADHIETLNIPVVRYTIKNDMVSQLPLRAFGYSHAGIEFFSDDKLVKCRLDYDEDPNCALKAESLAWGEHYNPDQQPMPKPIYC